MPPTRIRPATVADLPALQALEALFPVDRMSRRSLRHALAAPSACCLVSTDVAGVNGYGLNFYRRGSRQGRLYSIIVHPAARRRGIAEALLAALEANARARGCSRLRLEVQTGNAAAIRFYEKHGYTAGGHKPGYYNDGSDALCMHRTLPACPPETRT